MMNCTTCGAQINSVIKNCEYCGTEIENKTVLSPTEYVAAIGRALMTAESKHKFQSDAERAKISTLEQIPIPMDIPTLTAFFMFCHSNTRTGLESQSPLPLAWQGKAKSAYDMLRLASINNSQLSSFLAEFKDRYSDEAIKKLHNQSWGIVGAIAGIMAVGFLVVHLLSR